MLQSEQRAPVRAPVYGGRFMAVTGHSAATLAAVSAHRAGGNVVDAALAASAALAVVVGQATSIGGDCFVLYHEAATGRTWGLNGSGVAPAAATPEVFAGGMQVHGPLAPVIPGLVRAWEALHRRFGSLPWARLLDDSIALADGHAVSYILSTRLGDDIARLARDPGCAGVYMPGGKPIAVGETLRQPALARTLRRIAEQGADELYRGETARSIAACFARAGGLITEADLAGFQPMWVEPMATNYRGHRVSVMPPNSCGALLLLQLNGLSALDSAELIADPGRTVGYQMSALKAAAAAGVTHIADPAAVPHAARDLLAAETTAGLQAAVRAMVTKGRVGSSGGTACVLAADCQGNMISIVQSIYNVFGSMLLDPATGILFNNRMQDFAAKAGSPNSVGPGKRPFHTLCPVIVHKGDRPRYALASPGGISQTLTHAQLVTQLVDRGQDVAAAVEAPRWCNRKGGDFLIEPGFPPAVAEAVNAMGHEARQGGDPYFYGSAKAIEWLETRSLAGAGDFRREAFALGY